ncbi:MAG: SpoIIE family protein phosphatase [Magnetococcales bacterium]|nr:SpoIIE family protein phosphatase [Magnetococcales bacterium]
MADVAVVQAKHRILVVDDERFNLNLMVDLLRDEFDTLVAKDGAMALRRVRSDTPPDLILLDVMMPDMDGYEVCRQIRADEATQAIPIIFVTAMGSNADEAKGLALGAVDYITKPISPPIVLARVRNHLALHLARQEMQRKNQELSRWQQQMELLMRHAPSAIALFDKNLNYLQVSHRWLDDYNLHNQAVHGHSHWDLCPGLAGHWRAVFQRCLAGVWERHEADPILNEQFGRMQWIKWEAFPWRNEAGEVGGVVMHTEDVTDRKLMENEVIRHRDHLADAQRIVSTVIEKMQASHPFCAQNVRYLSIPVDQISGDMVLSTCRPDGGHHVLVGDFTGHGIAAAISGPMVADIFCTMTSKGLDMAEIVAEINKKLCKQIPSSMFLAAAFLELSPDRTALRIWNCAGPDLLVMRAGRLQERIESGFLPRGILMRPENSPREVLVSPGDRVFVTTDGIVETQGADGSQLGIDRLQEMLESMLEQNGPLAEIAARVLAFRAGREQEDDLTLLEMTC